MIITTYKCDLCRHIVNFPYGGYRLSFSGDGAIGLEFLDKATKSESIICKHCVRGLRYGLSHLPKDDKDDEPQT